jgi:hypothetical protein
VAAALCQIAVSPLAEAGWNWPGTAPAWDETKQLVSAIETYSATCASSTRGTTDEVQRCNDEKADLLARQRKLGVSDDLINTRIKNDGKDWRWP